ncbi:MAG TPA: LLM class flavin-dependent oxidoreductase [Pseudonocardiaceae bacterium]|jgi:alkanesulfonate monooxygenase SsuD/methylene tetrahydromethanopterin reductase-like flavin-dependent oxidoreductase (luciferase family)|nr:LLM class flavin-dependent oxidoreductase [Pseudonocardiaceae bacterium]
MRIGIVILPEYRWWVAEPKWRAAESYGFNHAWTYDHLSWRSLADGPWFGAMPTLTAAAMVTERIKLGTFVASPNFRHPASFLREVTTLDDISDGRFLLGIGAGGYGFDSTVLGGQPLSRKALVDRLGEFLDLLHTGLTNNRTDWQGEYYTAVDARSAPGCVQRPRVPFLVAASGPRAIGLAARYGQGWVTIGKPTEDVEQWWRSVAELSDRMTEALAEAGRAPASLARYLSLDVARYSLTSVECFTEMVGRAGALGFTDVIAHWPRADGVYAGRESVLEAVASDVLPVVSAG